MTNYIKYALEKMAEEKFKLTKPRKMIVELLAKSDKALTPYEMRDILKKKKINADVVTIYRVLEVLERMSLAHKVQAMKGFVRCSSDEIGHEEGDHCSCHHHLLCRKCHKVTEFHCEDLSDLQKKVSKKEKFHIDSHYLEFMGLCESCKKHDKKKKS